MTGFNFRYGANRGFSIIYCTHPVGGMLLKKESDLQLNPLIGMISALDAEKDM